MDQSVKQNIKTAAPTAICRQGLKVEAFIVSFPEDSFLRSRTGAKSNLLPQTLHILSTIVFFLGLGATLVVDRLALTTPRYEVYQSPPHNWEFLERRSGKAFPNSLYTANPPFLTINLTIN